MPRAHNSVPSTLRNRNRVTNKTRLKIVKGDIDGDPLAFDDGEEKARVVSTAGVDAEDANEHHLQAVLSAASLRHRRSSRAERLANKEHKQQDAYIPIPDNTGLVDDYERLYPPNRWCDPASYVKMSETVEEAVLDALSDGSTYYMDERDNEWLDKNNEAARGEGTSAQGAVSSSGATTRTSQRSAKAKGKEPDTSQPVAISEDEFELVMGVLEKVTKEKTPFLHHGLENNAPFPPFSDYQEIFAAELPPSMFATFVVPASLPAPSRMLRYVKAVYPHWKERRVERQGRRVIPTPNYNESDVKNESYICFRHRDVKAMRKTRASQASSSEKLLRLQQKLATTHELSRNLCVREVLKRELTQSARMVWERREEFATLKRKFPTLDSMEDEELLQDRECLPKRPKGPDPSTRIGIKFNPRDSEMSSPVAKSEPVNKPKDRLATILSRIDQSLSNLHERDSCWDDCIDNSYQAPPATLPQKLFKFVSPPGQSAAGAQSFSPIPHGETPRVSRAIRMRRGRGGVVRIDRREFTPRSLQVARPFSHSQSPQDHGIEGDSDETQERDWRLRDRWMFDEDDQPSVGPGGPDEQARTLVDECDPKYLRKLIGLLSQRDVQTVRTDPVLRWSSVDGRQYAVNPFITATHLLLQKEQQRVYLARAHAQHQAHAQAQAKLAAAGSGSGQQQAVQQQQVQRQAALAVALSRTTSYPPIRVESKRGLSSTGATQIRPPGGAVYPPATPSPPLAQSAITSQASPPHSTRSLHAMKDADQDHQSKSTSNTSVSPTPSHTMNVVSTIELPTSSLNSATQLQPPNDHDATTISNGHPTHGFPPFHQNGTSCLLPNNGHANPQPRGFRAYSSMQNGQDMTASVNVVNLNSGSRAAASVGHNGANYTLQGCMGDNVSMNMSGVNMNLKLPASRQMQWAAAQGLDLVSQGRASHPPRHLGGSSQGIAIVHSLSPCFNGASPAGHHVSPPRASQSPSIHQQQPLVNGMG